MAHYTFSESYCLDKPGDKHDGMLLRLISKSNFVVLDKLDQCYFF